MSSTPNSTVEASTTSSSPASCMASNNNAPKYGTRVPNRVFVGGLSADTTEEEMQCLFSNYGQVSSAKIISDRAGVSKGYGFITFETEDQARNLLRMSEVYLKNRKLNIAPAIKKQYDVCGSLQPQYNGRTYDAPSPSVPSGSVYYSSGGVPYTFQNNGMSYYPAAAAAAAAAAHQEAYNAAAANYVSQPQAQAAASYPGYPYMYPAAQAMYAPQQYSYQTMPPPALPAPTSMVPSVMYTSSSSSPPLQGCMALTNGPLSAAPSPSLQTQQQLQSTYFMTDAAGNNMAFPLNMAFTLLPINNGEVTIQELSNGGDVCTSDTNTITANGDETQQVSLGVGQYIIDSTCFSSPPPPVMLPMSPPPSNGDIMLPCPPVCTYIPPPPWSPLLPPPPEPQLVNEAGDNNNGFRDFRQQRGGRRGGGGGRGRYQKFTSCGDYQQQQQREYKPRRDVPPRMNNPRQYKYQANSPSITPCPNEMSTNPPLMEFVPMCNNNNFMPEIVKMVHSLQVNN